MRKYLHIKNGHTYTEDLVAMYAQEVNMSFDDYVKANFELVQPNLTENKHDWLTIPAQNNDFKAIELIGGQDIDAVLPKLSEKYPDFEFENAYLGPSFLKIPSKKRVKVTHPQTKNYIEINFEDPNKFIKDLTSFVDKNSTNDEAYLKNLQNRKSFKNESRY